MSDVEVAIETVDEQTEFTENEEDVFIKQESKKPKTVKKISISKQEARKSAAKKHELQNVSLSQVELKKETLTKSDSQTEPDSEKLSTSKNETGKSKHSKKVPTQKTDTEKRDSIKARPSTTTDTEKTDLSKPRSSTAKADTEKRDSIKARPSTTTDTEKTDLSKPRPSTAKSDTEKTDSSKPRPSTAKSDTEKTDLSKPRPSTAKTDSSKHELEDFEEEKSIELIGELNVELSPFGKEKEFFYFPDKGEYPSIWGEYESSEVSTASATAFVSEVEETEEEKEKRKEREALIDSLRQKIFDRMLLRRRNTFLNKKLVEHFKKRRMENVLKDEPKGLNLENKYLRSLYAFMEFKQSQEKEINDLTDTMEKYEDQIKQLELDLEENLKNSANRAKEVSLNLILTKTGKKINEKTVDRLLRRQIQKSEEKGKEKLKYIKIKNLIEEKELQLKAMEYFGEGLHIAVYEQMKIDNQNYSDKIEEKEDELTKLRLKTQTMIQNLAHVKEKIYAVEGDIELMEEKVFDVEKTFVETRERLTAARIKRDTLRALFRRNKNASGLLTRTDLLQDFEESIAKAKNLSAYLQKLKKSVHDKNKQENKLAKIISNVNSTGNSETLLPMKIKIRSRTNHFRDVYTPDKAMRNSVDLTVRTAG